MSGVKASEHLIPALGTWFTLAIIPLTLRYYILNMYFEFVRRETDTLDKNFC